MRGFGFDSGGCAGAGSAGGRPAVFREVGVFAPPACRFRLATERGRVMCCRCPGGSLVHGHRPGEECAEGVRYRCHDHVHVSDGALSRRLGGLVGVRAARAQAAHVLVTSEQRRGCRLSEENDDSHGNYEHNRYDCRDHFIARQVNAIYR